MAKAKPELLPGTLDMLVLQTLSEGPLHGYAIAKTIRTVSRDVLDVEQGSLYPALFRMERRGWVRSKWGRSDTKRRVKLYRLTAEGRRHLHAQESAWDTFVTAVQRIMERS